jgi:predicted metal-dependent phosphoesterase TrpH
MKLKALLHVHTRDDPKDHLSYTLYDVLDRCAEEGFEVVALTCHGKVIIQEEYQRYAEQKRILLLSGIEALVEGKDVLLINVGPDAEQVTTFEDLAVYKQQHPDMLVIAAHPYLLFWRSLRGKIIQYADLFDAYEFHWFYSPHVNFNKKTIRLAHQFNKPLVGTSDVHTLEHMFTTYSTIDAPEKSISAVLAAIRSGHIQYTTTPCSFWRMGIYYLHMMFRHFFSRPGKA